MKRKIPKSFYITLAGIAFVSTMFIEYITAYNMAVDYETRIDAQWNNNRNTLSQYNLKIQEAVQVPEMYRDDFLEVISTSMTGRYGKQGSQASMQWLKEHSVELPNHLYTQLHQMIEAGRNDFQNEQKKLLDLTRSYKRSTRTFWTGFIMKLSGFPSDEFSWSKYEVLVDTDTDKHFYDQQAEPLKLR